MLRSRDAPRMPPTLHASIPSSYYYCAILLVIAAQQPMQLAANAGRTLSGW